MSRPDNFVSRPCSHHRDFCLPSSRVLPCRLLSMSDDNTHEGRSYNSNCNHHRCNHGICKFTHDNVIVKMHHARIVLETITRTSTAIVPDRPTSIILMIINKIFTSTLDTKAFLTTFLSISSPWRIRSDSPLSLLYMLIRSIGWSTADCDYRHELKPPTDIAYITINGIIVVLFIVIATLIQHNMFVISHHQRFIINSYSLPSWSYLLWPTSSRSDHRNHRNHVTRIWFFNVIWIIIGGIINIFITNFNMIVVCLIRIATSLIITSSSSS